MILAPLVINFLELLVTSWFQNSALMSLVNIAEKKNQYKREKL